MKGKLIAIAIIAVLMSVTSVMAAKPTATGFRLPTKAKEVAPGVYRLGYAIDNGKFVEGYAFVKYKKDFVKPGTVCGNGICDPGENINKCPEDCGGIPDDDPTDTSSCYSFISKGAGWINAEPYIIDATNDDGILDTTVMEIMEIGIQSWEEVAYGKNIIGEGQIVDFINESSIEIKNEKNEVIFGNISQEGAIAVTIVWGVFGGPPPFREIVEWDMIFDEVDFDWSSTGEQGKMDFANIAIHELGHSMGMGDIYDTACSEQTMYGYATPEETKKTSLEDGDIAGIRELYK